MRCNPWRWMWGLLPLGLLCATALYFESGPIEADLQTRAEAALAGAGLKWAKASSDGRDVAITGKALDDADPVRAESIVRDVWGVRVASNQVELVEKAESFLWYVSRDGNRARLRGMVPNEDTRAAIIGYARQTFAGAQIDDEMRHTRGVPSHDTWLTGVTFALKQIAGLKSGEARLDGLGLTMTGEAANSAGYRSVKAALASGMPRGIRLLSDRVTAPVASPYVWSAKHSGGQVLLSGHVPSEKAREDLVTAAKAAFGRATVTDRMEAADGAPPGFAAIAGASLREMARLDDGTADTRDAQLTVAGLAADEPTADTARRNIKSGLPQGYRFQDQIKVRPAPPPVAAVIPPATPPPVKAAGPYVTTAAVNGTALVLAGFAPSEQARDSILQQARIRFPGKQINSALEIAPGAPDGWQRCIDGGLLAIARLGNGRLQISDKRLDVNGATDNEDLANAIPADVRQAVRGDCEANVRIDVLAEAVPELRWRAALNGKDLVLEGDVPSLAVRASLLQSAGRLFKDATVVDRMRVVETRTRKWPLVAEQGLKLLADLKQGEAVLDRQQLSVTGTAGDQQTIASVRERLGRDLQQGYAGREQISVTAVVAPPPPVIQAVPPVQPTVVAAPPPPTPAPRVIETAQTCQTSLRATANEGIILFQRASADIDRASFQTLDRLVSVVRTCPGVVIEIEGHTDAEGTPERKQKLSDRRAKSVAEYLGRAGIDQAKLQSVGYADSRPIAPNDTSENRARNRRIEFTVKSK